MFFLVAHFTSFVCQSMLYCISTRPECTMAYNVLWFWWEWKSQYLHERKNPLLVFGVHLCNLCSMYSNWICTYIPQIFDVWQKNVAYTVKSFFHPLFQVERLKNNLRFHTVCSIATHFTRTDQLINSILIWHRWQLLFVLFWIHRVCTSWSTTRIMGLGDNAFKNRFLTSKSN